MTTRQQDNIRIATKTLTYFVVPAGIFSIFYVVSKYVCVSDTFKNQIYPHEASYGELIGSFLVLLPLILSFVLPFIVLKRELNSRKGKEDFPSLRR